MLKLFGCSNEVEALKAEARGLEEKQIRAEEKVVQLDNELNAMKRKYGGLKQGFDDLSLELGLCEQKAKEQSEESNNRINELTSLLKLEVAKVEQLAQDKASNEKDSKRDYSRLGTLEGLEHQKRIDQSQFDDAMEQKQKAIEEMNRLRTNLSRAEHDASNAVRAADEMKQNYDQKIADLEHQLMYTNMQLNDKEVLLQDIPPLHMNILTLQNQLQQAQTHIIGEATVNQWKDELTSKNIELEKVQYQLEKTTALNAKHELLIDEQQKQILANAQEFVDLRRQISRVTDLEHQLVAAKREGDSAQQLMKDLSAMTAAKTAADQEIQRHLAIIDDVIQSADKKDNGDVARYAPSQYYLLMTLPLTTPCDHHSFRWKKAYEEMTMTKAVADHNVSQLTAQAHEDRDEIAALKQKFVELERQSRIAVDETGMEVNDLRTQLRMKEEHDRELEAQVLTKDSRIKELAGFIATLTAQNHAAENSISSLTKQRHFDQELLVNNRRELDDAVEAIQALQQKIAVESFSLKNQLTEMTAAKEALEVQRARDHEAMVNSTQSSKADMDAIAALRAENVALRAEFAQKEERVVALSQLQLSDKGIIDELRNLLDTLNKKQQALEDQLAVAATARTVKSKEEPATPADANKPLERSRSPSDMIPPKDLDVIPPSNSPLPKYRDAKDVKRLQDLELINDTLLSFARDTEFQQDLIRPLVRVAVDLWKGVNSSHADMESAKFDAGVIRIYPKLKSFEQQCSSAGLDQFPIDHVEARRTELSAEAVTKSFGALFVSNYYLNRAVKHSSP